MPTITKLSAREIIDSRGTPTVEVECTLSSGSCGTASVPSGASTGAHEACELRDGDKERFGGKGVLKAVAHVEGEIAQTLLQKEWSQRSLDEALIALDGTSNKSRLGANALLGVSFAFARACAEEEGLPLYRHLANLGGVGAVSLPEPAFNIINGGKHADSGLDIQEFMIVPTGIAGMPKKIQAASEIIGTLRALLHDAGLSTGVGDEGGFAPALSSNEEALDYLVRAITQAGYTTDECKIALDIAATSFYHDGTYKVRIFGEAKEGSADDLIEWYKALVSKYPIISIEDGLFEEDWEGFARLKKALGESVHIVGDDLLTTNIERMKLAHDYGSVTTALIKPNQIGTLSETIDAVLLARSYGWTTFASHRSGETTDTFIADFAVGLSCDFLKAGSLTRGERVCKYDRLLEIAEHLAVQS